MDDFYDFEKTGENTESETKVNPAENAEQSSVSEAGHTENNAENVSTGEHKERENFTSGEWHGTPYGNGERNFSYKDPDDGRNFSYKDPTGGWNTSSYYNIPTPEPKPPKKKYGAIVAVVSVFIILAMIASVAYGMLGGTNNLLSGNKEENKSGTENALQYKKPDGADDIKQNEDGSYTPADLYTMTSKSVVGVLNYINGSTMAQGSGSGIIISSDGYIVTNAHVVSDADAVSVVIYGENNEIEAKIIGSDARSDIAVLKIDRTNLTAVQYGISADIKVGEEVIAIGNPGGLKLSNSLTVGYISGIDRQVTIDNYTMNYLQTDAAINPGNSGGALFNMYGQLIGINSAKISDTNYEGIGFAIPIDTALPIIESIKSNGYVKGRVRIGITVKEVSELAARFSNIPEGLYIYSVDRSCDAYNKLKKGDIITEVNGKTVKTTSELFSILDSCSPGDFATIKLYRTSRSSGGYIEVSVKLSEDTGETDFDN